MTTTPEKPKNKRMSMSFQSTAFMFSTPTTTPPPQEEGNKNTTTFNTQDKRDEIEAKKKTIKQGLLNIRNKLFKKQDVEIFEGTTSVKTPSITPLNRSPTSTPNNRSPRSPTSINDTMFHKLERKNTLEDFFSNKGIQTTDIYELLKNTSKCDKKHLEKQGVIYVQTKENIFEERFVEVVGIQLKIYKPSKKEKKLLKVYSLFNFQLETLENWSILKKNSENVKEQSISFLFTLHFPNEDLSFATSKEEMSDWIDLFNLFELRNFSSMKPVEHVSKLNEMETRIQDEYKLIMEDKRDFEKLNSENFSFEMLETLYHKRIQEIQVGINITQK